ncbi:MAG: DUF434 domain-containing protein [Candidatus Hodarchaeales archaeon]
MNREFLFRKYTWKNFHSENYQSRFIKQNFISIFDPIMIIPSLNLKDSYSDLCFLLDRGYPKQSALNYISNHYQLTKRDRYILNRASCSHEDYEIINRKVIKNPLELRNKDFYIDLYNQYTTFQSLIDDEPLLSCRDGFIRDLFSILHSKKDLRIQEDMVEKYLEGYLKLNPESLTLYFDQQRSHSRIHLRNFEEILNSFSIKGFCVLSSTVDHDLKTQQEVIIFSHDSIILRESESSFNYFNWFMEIKRKKNGLNNQILNFDG